ncbi:ATP-binding cassette domain-containing protein [Psychrobacter sp. NG27]|uniref:ABC transporter ATP-binding protein n=1 Tax=Psychrobacter sp. NG27 TaxID=2781966 RepID=UPI0018E053CE|nr:ATP-binding cassette domain-containing protein [Psychrobacter sp. NG27]MBI0425199.1 ATP-binding cassette domain-containing protein [Psychrobacter sp. NG27]
MSTNSDSPIIEFNHLWFYSRPTTSLAKDTDTNIAQIQDSTQKKGNALSTRYQKWTSKREKDTASSKALPANPPALISDVSGMLFSGQVTVLTGASGSGKSVLLRLLAGLLPISAGDVRLRSKAELLNTAKPNSDVYYSIHETSYIEWRQQVALLSQHPQLIEGSVLDNLKMPYDLQAHESQTFDIDWHIAQLVHLGKSAAFLQQNSNYLSGGERQLVNTLRLLQLNPRVLLLDEPTAALDVDTSAQLVSLLIRWLQADRQRTLLWVTHDTKDIMPLADRHWHMQAGVLTTLV